MKLMGVRMKHHWLLIAFALLSGTAKAETQAQHDRLDLLARYTVSSSICEKLGMAIPANSGEQIQAAVEAEVSSWGLNRADAGQLMNAAVERQLRILQIDLRTASDNAKTAAQLRKVRLHFIQYGAMCIEAANDVLFSRFLKAPVGFDLEAAATVASDNLLEDGGLASWQTPAITARGDMVMLAGACRRHIGQVRSDQLFQSYGRSDNPRERAFYSRSFDKGLTDTELQEFDATQCARAIGRYREKIRMASAK